ncbi:MAG TPA: gamma-glutamylcyclotransferase family protein [Solirubrobacterales bacterium]|nr:gamma-glutamylcyclotransferase family protein [Solirubrobacterales bacterium]
MTRTALFAYGSLVDPASAAITLGRPVELVAAVRLPGWRRTWTQGRDNRRVEKTFARADDGGIPPWCIGLNLEPEPDSGRAPNGALFEVGEADLARLDVRELRYTRTDVTAALPDTGFERVVTYIARPEHHHRVAPPGAVVIGAYLQAVERAFERLGEGELERFRETTGAPPVEIIEARLVRDRIPPGNPREW